LSCPRCEYTTDGAADLEAHVDLEHVKRAGGSAAAAAVVAAATAAVD